jgi:hypothetical protein
MGDEKIDNAIPSFFYCEISSFGGMNTKWLWMSIFLLLAVPLPAREDSICAKVLHYKVLDSNEPTEGFFWVAGSRKYDVYARGNDIILEARKKKQLWLIPGATLNQYPGTEMYIDTVYLQNTSESPDKELVIGYSVYSMKPDNHGVTKFLSVIDLRDKVLLLNIAYLDNRVEKDENGKYYENLYECDIDFFHDGFRITSSDDSDINDTRTQLDDGIYYRRGHCHIRHR